MAAPTPASAYLHAAAMVKAGVYLMARILVSVLVFPPKIGLLLGAFAVITMLTSVFLMNKTAMFAYAIQKIGDVHLVYLFSRSQSVVLFARDFIKR